MKTCWMSTSFEQRQSERRFQQIAVALVVVLVSLQQNVAFGQSASAAVNGTGRDKSGALVSEAQLILKSTDTGVQHTDKTESAGVYSLTGIPPDYFARAVKNGFATMEETGMVLHVNQTATLDFTMGIGSLDQVVTVVANLLAVDSTTSERMPGISGLELQAKLNADHCPIPTIFITAHGDEEMRLQAV